MDYRRLSRESLIHEITQLHQELDKYKLSERGETLGIDTILGDVETPVYFVGIDYNVIWANSYCLDHFTDISRRKCYNIFFGRSEVCPECDLPTHISDNKFTSIHLELNQKEFEIFQIPMKKMPSRQGILEFHYPLDVHAVKETDYKRAYKRVLLENELLRKSESNAYHYIQELAKAMRTPLRAFNGFFQIQSDQIAYLNVLKTSSELLYELLNKLMLYANRDSTIRFSQKEDFNLLKAIDEVTQQAKLYFVKDKPRRVKLKCAPTIPEVIKGNALQFKQLLSYVYEWTILLCGNEDIELTISEISQTHTRLYLKFVWHSILENEVYLQNELESIEEKSYESIEHYSAVLAQKLLVNILNDLGGHLDTQSGLDGELDITVILDFEKLIPKKEILPVLQRGAKKKVLIADFEKPGLSLEHFEKLDFYFAQTGDEAIQMYFEVHPDLTIINVSIDECDGFEVFDALERRRKVHRPIVAMSYKLIDSERLFMQDYGFDDYISKPLIAETFQQIMDKYL